MEFGKIIKQTGFITLDEFDSLIKTEEQLTEIPDRIGKNPFTSEKVIFSGKGKADFRVENKNLGNLSLESGVILTTGVPVEFCKNFARKLCAIVLKDDRS